MAQVHRPGAADPLFLSPLPRCSSSKASPFCLSSAVSLSAFFNNGAVPCACHQVGAESDACEAFGGQCRCRPNVIGRDCSMCATGFWGFPNCRRECVINTDYVGGA